MKMKIFLGIVPRVLSFEASETEGSEMYLKLLVQIHLFLKLVLASISIDLQNVDYCQLCKKKGTHTVCRFPRPGPQPPCQLAPLSLEEKQRILKAHNVLRDRVGRGKQLPQPPAGDMLRLRWDDELEAVAERWAAQCVDKHDACRVSARFAVGQNIAWRSHWDLERLVQLWFDEVALFDPAGVGAYVFEAATGHYTQLVWAHTRLVGCARTDRGRALALRFVLVCNYGPAGNVISRPLYTVAAPTSACPAGASPDQEFGGLCALPGADFTPLRLHPALAPRPRWPPATHVANWGVTSWNHTKRPGSGSAKNQHKQHPSHVGRQVGSSSEKAPDTTTSGAVILEKMEKYDVIFRQIQPFIVLVLGALTYS